MVKTSSYQRENIEQRVISFIQQNELINPGEKMVVGVSGGADSVCLLHILSKWHQKLGISLHIAHLNHQLRGAESEADAEYVTNLARRFDMPATIESYDVKSYKAKKRCSLEEAAREVRYEFLARVAKKIGTKIVAVGHTRDDHIETILMHLIRGTGIAGLRGLRPHSEMTTETGSKLEIVRPLLKVSRQETATYCKKHRLTPRLDSSNLSLTPLRNRIRLEVLPLLRKYNPNFDEALERLAEIADDELSFIEEQTEKLWTDLVRQEENVIRLDCNQMKSLPLSLQRQLVRSAISKLLSSLKDIEAEHIEAVIGQLEKPAGKKLNLPHGLVSLTDYGHLILKLGKASACPLPPLEQEYKLRIPGETFFPGWRVTASISEKLTKISDNNLVAYFDLDKAGKRLLVRKRQPGDRFKPLGMKELKKLQDFMVDAKIPNYWRERVPLVCSSEHILWVVGWRMDERGKVTRTTRKVLRIEFEPLPQ